MRSERLSAFARSCRRVLSPVALPVLLLCGAVTLALAIPRSERAGAAAPVWPAPPDPPRLRWLASVASDRDAGMKRSWMDRVRTTITGGTTRRLGRPIGLCALPSGGFLVCDPGSATVYEADPFAGTFRVFVSGGRLASPVGVVKLPSGDVVADADRAVLVRFDARGAWKGELGAGVLVRPTGLARDPASGRVYVADAHAHRIAVFEADGRHVADLGRRGDGAGEFNFPTDVEVLPGGDLVVCDAMNSRIQRIAPDGRPVARFGRAGDARGDFGRPKAIAVDADGHVYVVDTLHDVVQIFDASGQLLLVVGGAGAAAGQFNQPAGIAIGPDQKVYVSDTANGRVQVFQYLREDAGARR